MSHRDPEILKETGRQFKEEYDQLEKKVKKVYDNFNKRSMRENISAFLNSLEDLGKKSLVYSKAGYIQVKRFLHECKEPGLMINYHQSPASNEKFDWKGLAKLTYCMIHPKGRQELIDIINHAAAMSM